MTKAQDLIPLGARDFLILFALVEGERHGYGIVREVERESRGQVRIDPANLYRSVKRMLGAGLVEDAGSRSDGTPGAQRRRYYRITALGRDVVTLEAARLAELAARARARGLLPGDEARA